MRHFPSALAISVLAVGVSTAAFAARLVAITGGANGRATCQAGAA
jgi:hypothetical protein